MILQLYHLQKGFNDVIKMATEIHSLRFGALSPNFALHKSLQKIIDLYIPEDISNAQDRLYISLTDQKVEFLCRQNVLFICFDVHCLKIGYQKI